MRARRRGVSRLHVGGARPEDLGSVLEHDVDLKRPGRQLRRLVAGRAPISLRATGLTLERKSCEHLFVTSQGAALTRYRRAIETKSMVLAEHAAREMGHVPLGDALALVLLYASARSPKAEPAAVRWLARLALERPGTTIGELQLAAAALGQLEERPKTAARTLLELAS